VVETEDALEAEENSVVWGSFQTASVEVESDAQPALQVVVTAFALVMAKENVSSKGLCDDRANHHQDPYDRAS
jgi:hypothetical protein